MKKVIFVCTGNTCRSPMAEAVFKDLLLKNGNNGISCESAGIFTKDGLPATKNAVKACEEIGLDISNHKTKICPREDTGIDLFVAVTGVHAQMLGELGIPTQKIYKLRKEIEDPFGKKLESYQDCRDELKETLSSNYDEIVLRANGA